MATIVINPGASSGYPLSSDNVFGPPSGIISVSDQLVLTGVTTVLEDTDTFYSYSNTSGYVDQVVSWDDGSGPKTTSMTIKFGKIVYDIQVDGPGGSFSHGFGFAPITEIDTDGIVFIPTVPIGVLDDYETHGASGGVLPPPGLRGYDYYPFGYDSGDPATQLVGADSITNLAGAAALYGYAGNDVLVAGNSGDTLDGGAGADTMTGGAGDDTFYVDQAGDVVHEAPGGGFDTVMVSSPFWKATAGAEIEKVVATGSANIALTGNGFHMELDGNDGVNTLDDGGTADTMSGGGGADVYIVRDAGDVMVEASGGGYDTVKTGLPTFTLPDNVEVLIYTGKGDFIGTGNGQANEIVGGAGDDKLDGGGGVDRLTGGGGNDTYYVDDARDTVIEKPGGGFDTIFATSSAFVAPANVEALIYAGTGNFHGYANATGVSITSGAGDDFIYGGAGNDVLDGVGGYDILRGGGGADTFILNSHDQAQVRIQDFQAGVDKIVYNAPALFEADGSINPDYPGVYYGFNIDPPFGEDHPRANLFYFEYDQASGSLYFVSEAHFEYPLGYGFAPAYLIATFDNHPALSASDFIVSG